MKFDLRVLGGGAALAFVVFLGGCLGFINPRNSEISNQQTLLSSAQQQEQQFRSEYLSISSGTKFAGIESQSGLLQQAIPSDVDLAGIINNVYSAAALSGVPVTSFSAPTPGSSGTGAPAASSASSSGAQAEHLSITTSGRYFQIVDFIDQLQQLPRIYVVTSVSLSGGSSLQSDSPDTLFTPVLTASIAASTFFTGTPPVAVVGLPSSGTAGNGTATSVPGSAATVPSTVTTVPGAAPSTTTVPGAAPSSTTVPGAAPSTTTAAAIP